MLAHVDAGKTTLSEAILYRTGEIRRLGRVDHGDAYLDDSEIERNRGITVFSKQARFRITPELSAAASREAAEITMIDTPGHVDFAAEMERSLSVIDYALLVVSGSEGVQAHTRTLHRILSDKGIPVFVFINKMDIAVRKKEEILAELASELGAGAADFGPVCGASGMPDDFIDAVTLYSPELAEIVLGDGPGITDADIAAAVRSGQIVPCVFGSALKLEGIEDLLEILARFTVEPEYGKEFGARVYKVTNAEDGERLSFIKVTGGELKVREKVTGKSRNGAEWEAKVNQIRLYSGSKFVTAESAAAGAVCAVTGFTEAVPGDVLGAEILPDHPYIEPFMIYTVTGPEDRDPYLVMKDLKKLEEEDPSLNVKWREDTHEIEIRIMGQVQLEVISTIIEERFGYKAEFGTGKVLYLETVSGRYEGVGHFEPLRHYAEVHLIVEPEERGSGIVISSITPEDELARNWQRLIMTHIEEKEHLGVLTGSPLTDVRITLAAGRAHDKHTSGGDFREATYRAVRNALMQAREDGKAVLLEPWYDYEIVLPAQSVGRAMTDIRQMGGTQDELEQTGDTAKVRGKVPASGISGYQQVLTGYTAGEGKLACTPAGYAECHDAERVIEEAGYDPERDVDNPADSVFVSHGATDIVKWYDVPEHMHIGSVLRRLEAGETHYNDAGRAETADRTGSVSGSKEERARALAAEKELKHIFEMTYGTERTGKVRREARVIRPAEERDDARNQEIRAKHTRQKEGVIKETLPPLIIVDGYNLIYADKYTAELAKEDIGAATMYILERLSNFSGYRGTEVIAVFDAYKLPYGIGSEEDYLGVKVIYTAEDEPADIRIGIITSEVSGRDVYVVSSDVLVQQDSFGHGALRISSREFVETLAKTEDEIRAQL